jgi:hypothetical protein
MYYESQMEEGESDFSNHENNGSSLPPAAYKQKVPGITRNINKKGSLSVLGNKRLSHGIGQCNFSSMPSTGTS